MSNATTCTIERTMQVQSSIAMSTAQLAVALRKRYAQLADKEEARVVSMANEAIYLRMQLQFEQDLEETRNALAQYVAL